MRRLAVLAPILLVAAACGGGGHAASTATTTTSAAVPTAKKLHVAIRGQDHHPKVGGKWHYDVRVTDAATGKPVACRIHLQFYFGGVSVGEVGKHVLKNGVWQETIGAPGNPPFPPAARNQHLVLHVIVTAKGYKTAQAGWPIVPK